MIDRWFNVAAQEAIRHPTADSTKLWIPQPNSALLGCLLRLAGRFSAGLRQRADDKLSPGP
jgi:hypothetical protein